MITLVLSLVGIIVLLVFLLFVVKHAWDEPIPEPKEYPPRTPRQKRAIQKYHEMLARVHGMDK